jgi:hypothetical protein
VGGEQSLRITSLCPSGLALPLQRLKGAVVNPQAHTLAAAVVGSSSASAERRRVEARGVGKTYLHWTVSADERAAPLQRPPPRPVLFCA